MVLHLHSIVILLPALCNPVGGFGIRYKANLLSGKLDALRTSLQLDTGEDNLIAQLARMGGPMDTPHAVEMMTDAESPTLREDPGFNALQRLVKLCRTVLGSYACSISWVGWIDETMLSGQDHQTTRKWVRDEQKLMTVVCDGREDFIQSMAGRVVQSRKYDQEGYINSELFHIEYFNNNKYVEVFDLCREGNGVCNPKVAEELGLASLLATPICFGDEIVGFINHFTAKPAKQFGKPIKKKLSEFAILIAHLLEQERTKAVFRELDSLIDRLTIGDISLSVFQRQLIELICTVLDIDVGVVWHHDVRRKRLIVTATTPYVEAHCAALRTMSLNSKNVGYNKLCEKINEPSFIIQDVRTYPKYEDAHRPTAISAGLCTLLTVPLRVVVPARGKMASELRLLGAIDVYTREVDGRKERPFDDSERRLLVVIAQRAAHALYHADIREESRLKDTLRALTQDARHLADRPLKKRETLITRRREFLKCLAERTTELTHVGCIVWDVDHNTNQFWPCGWFEPPSWNQDKPDRLASRAIKKKLAFKLDTELGTYIMLTSEPNRLPDLEQDMRLPDVWSEHLGSEVEEVLVHCITALHTQETSQGEAKVDEKVLGCIGLYRKRDVFLTRHVEQIKTIVELAADDLEHISAKLQQVMLSEVLPELSKLGIWHGDELGRDEQNGLDQEPVKRFYDYLLSYAKRLVGGERGGIAKYGLDDRLHPVSGYPDDADPLTIGLLEDTQTRGITGLAVYDGKVINARDVREYSAYHDYYRDTRSEIAVPLVIDEPVTRDGDQPRRVAKKENKKMRLGVLNLESPTKGAFTLSDERVLHAFGSLLTTLLAAQDFAWKIQQCTEFGREFFEYKIWDRFQAYERLREKIGEVLSYDFVNISHVDTEKNVIKTVFAQGVQWGKGQEIEGVSPDQAFVDGVEHDLDGEDIQVIVYQSRTPIAPPPDDPRLDSKVFKKYGHKRLTRVIVPILNANNECVGTLEAGKYDSPRPYILESDVYLLTIFASYLARFFSKVRGRKVQTINHEILNTVNGIRHKASFLARYGLRRSISYVKLDDILSDCGTLSYQVWGLRHLFGLPQPPRLPGKILFYRDVIVKNVQQLKREARERNLDSNQIKVNDVKLNRLPPLWVDPARLNQVIWNLLINSIKYARRGLNRFSLYIDMDERDEGGEAFWVLKIQDKGIGVKTTDREKIFQDGYRSLEAQKHAGVGHGIGLPLARGLMREIGGDVRLGKCKEPTEFQVWIPKAIEHEEAMKQEPASNEGRS